MEFQLCPSFDHSKLENPSFEDLVDIFEDMWFGYVFLPAKELLKIPNGEVSAMTILSSYFEAIESYLSGESSENNSKEFFKKGFCKVFSSNSAGIEFLAGHFYKHVRCGLAHEGLLSYRVCYSANGSKPIVATYPKKNGELIFDKGVESIILNPHLIYNSLEYNLKKYISDLRSKKISEINTNFEKSMRRQLGGKTRELIAALTEEEFLGKA